MELTVRAMPAHIRIDDEFQHLIPPLSVDELEMLEESIVNEGCRDALIVWDGILLDGHHRYAICTRHGIEYQVVEKEFDSRDSALEWVLRNQLGRRNLTNNQRAYLLGKLYESRKRREGRPEKRYHDDTVMGRVREQVAQETGISAPTVARAAQFARAVDEIEELSPGFRDSALAGEVSQKDTIAIAALPSDEAREAAIERKPHVAQNSRDNEWYTPAEYIEAARTVMGGIDLDPASSEEANSVVKAEAFYSKEDDGLAQEWAGRIFMNPPYAQPLISQFAKRLVESVLSGTVKEAIVLVNNATETNWFSSIINVSSAVIFPAQRIKFWGPDGKVAAPLQGQALIYIGQYPTRFRDEFSHFGWGADTWKSR